MSTVKELRTSYVKTVKKYVGCAQGSKYHRQIVDAFNVLKPDGEVMTYSAAWCAASVTAWAYMCFKDKASKAFPLDYNVGTLVSKAKKLGAWVEKDTYTPTAGDLIVFSWSPYTSGEITSGASHVGVVESVSAGFIHTIEGNFSTSKKCGRRSIPVGWVYIRGFIVPKYEKLATKAAVKKTAAKTATKKTTAASRTLYTVTAKAGLNVRAGAGFKYKVKTAIPYGTKVYIYQKKDAWGYSKALGGWLSMHYLKKA